MIVAVQQANLTDAADAVKLGIPQRADKPASEDTAPRLVRQAREAPVTHFPARTLAEGFKIARDRIMRFGGSFSTPKGPALNHPRVRAGRRPVATGPRPNATSVRDMPAGLTPTMPWWEDHLSASSGYLAP